MRRRWSRVQSTRRSSTKNPASVSVASRRRRSQWGTSSGSIAPSVCQRPSGILTRGWPGGTSHVCPRLRARIWSQLWLCNEPRETATLWKKKLTMSQAARPMTTVVAGKTGYQSGFTTAAARAQKAVKPVASTMARAMFRIVGAPIRTGFSTRSRWTPEFIGLAPGSAACAASPIGKRAEPPRPGIRERRASPVPADLRRQCSSCPRR